MSEESRADRLRQRRKESSDRTSDRHEQDTTDEPSKPDKPSEPNATGTESTTQTSVKEQQTGTYMYLPESQKRELDKLYSLLKAEYEYEYDRDFQKNRHFYPVVIQAGLDALDGIDMEDIPELLDRLE